MWIFLVSILSPVLGLSALISENSVQTEGGKHLCTLCGKVVRAIRQHIRGCSQVKRCMVILLVDRRLVAAFASLPDNLATVLLTPCLTVGRIFPRTCIGPGRHPTTAPPAACPRARGTRSSCTCTHTIPTGGGSSWTHSRSRA